MKRMRDIRGGIAPHDGVARYGRDFCAAVIIGEAAMPSSAPSSSLQKAASRTRTGASRNWLDEFISGKFRGAFQEDLIDVDFVADDDEEGVDGVKEERSSDSPR